MEKIELAVNKNGRGYFLLKEAAETLGEMEIGILENELTVFHTEVIPKAEGKGIAKKLLSEMVDYSRKNNLKVRALCPFVRAQFNRHPEEYSDIIKK